MQLSDDIKAKIQAEYDSWKDKLWAGKDKAARAKLGQFATPPALTIKMLEKFDSLEGNVLDPCLGAGNLIAAAIIAGADPKRCYGIEIDEEVLGIARMRLAKLGVPPCNIVLGDALDPKNYEEKLQPFGEKSFATIEKIDSNSFDIVVNANGKTKEVIFSRDQANALLAKLKAKQLKIFKV